MKGANLVDPFETCVGDGAALKQALLRQTPISGLTWYTMPIRAGCASFVGAVHSILVISLRDSDKGYVLEKAKTEGRFKNDLLVSHKDDFFLLFLDTKPLCEFHQNVEKGQALNKECTIKELYDILSL
jgi:hypothetical protein